MLDIFIAVGMGQMDTYQHDFEDSLLTETAAYYKRKARAAAVCSAFVHCGGSPI